MASIITEFSNFVASIFVPDPGDEVTAASLIQFVQGLVNRTRYLQDKKVAKAGDTMTGRLTISAAAASNQQAIAATGNGGGAGITCTGGSGAGTGLIATGGAGGGNGLSATATGSGTGVVATGVDGEGLFCSCGTGVALHVSTGNAIFTGAAPAATADPVYNNFLCSANIPKAWGWIQTTGLGTGALQGSVSAGYNVTVTDVTSTYVELTFPRPFATDKYAPAGSPLDNPGKVPCFDMSTATASVLRVAFQNHAGGAADPSAVAIRFSIHVYGRQ